MSQETRPGSRFEEEYSLDRERLDIARNLSFMCRDDPEWIIYNADHLMIRTGNNLLLEITNISEKYHERSDGENRGNMYRKGVSLVFLYHEGVADDVTKIPLKIVTTDDIKRVSDYREQLIKKIYIDDELFVGEELEERREKEALQMFHQMDDELFQGVMEYYFHPDVMRLPDGASKSFLNGALYMDGVINGFPEIR